jgi:hypothetical protein
MALTKRQLSTLDKHKKHHSKKHMQEMKRLMNKGLSFTEAHRVAMKNVGE